MADKQKIADIRYCWKTYINTYNTHYEILHISGKYPLYLIITTAKELTLVASFSSLYKLRLQNIASNIIMIQTYSELSILPDCGFSTWITKVLALELNMKRGLKFKQYCENRIVTH